MISNINFWTTSQFIFGQIHIGVLMLATIIPTEILKISDIFLHGEMNMEEDCVNKNLKQLYSYFQKF